VTFPHAPLLSLSLSLTHPAFPLVKKN